MFSTFYHLVLTSCQHRGRRRTPQSVCHRSPIFRVIFTLEALYGTITSMPLTGTIYGMADFNSYINFSYDPGLTVFSTCLLFDFTI